MTELRTTTPRDSFDPESLVIRDQVSGRDVTHNYRVVRWEEGILTVKYDMTAVIATGSAVKLYDGTPLTCDELQDNRFRQSEDNGNARIFL